MDCMVATRASLVENIQIVNVTLSPATTTLVTRSNIGPTESLGPGSLAMTIIHAAAIIKPM